jgi:hypothetical protein
VTGDLSSLRATQHNKKTKDESAAIETATLSGINESGKSSALLLPLLV